MREPELADFEAELAAAGIRLRPRSYLSTGPEDATDATNAVDPRTAPRV